MKLNDKGFSLVQVLISSGLLGAAAVMGIKMMNNQQKVAESTNQKYEIAYIYEEIWRTLQNPLACEATFKGKSISEWNEQGIRGITSPYTDSGRDRVINIYRPYDLSFNFYGIKNLKIEKYELSRPETSLEPIMNLRIHFDRGTNIVGKRKIHKTIPITFKSSESKIETCSALALKDLSDDDLLESEDKGPIELAMKTSIGVDTSPVTSLDIHGDLTIKTSTNVDCNKSSEGTIRFNEISKNYEFCNGVSNWKPWGKNRVDWKFPIEEILVPSKTEIQELGTYKLCALSILQNTRPNDCRILNQTTDLNTSTQWKVAKSSTDRGRCIFLCFR
jgi:hypothetical protein